MLTLFRPIALPNIVGIRVKSLSIDSDQKIITAVAESVGPEGLVYGQHHLRICDGQCVGLRAKAAPTCFSDVVETFFTNEPVKEGYAQAVTALVGGQTAGFEEWLVKVGLLPEGKIA